MLKGCSVRADCKQESWDESWVLMIAAAVPGYKSMQVRLSTEAKENLAHELLLGSENL